MKKLSIDQATDLMVDGLRTSVPGLDLTETPNCEKYTLDGNKACSIIYK